MIKLEHGYPHKQFGEGIGGSSLDISCERCRDMIVGDLDNHNFQLLMNSTREEFEDWCRLAYGSDMTLAGIYNFWYGIMETKALKTFVRREELLARVERDRHV